MASYGDLGFFYWGCIKNKIWDVTQSQQPDTIKQLSPKVRRECRNMPAILIQNTFDGMVNR